ncbi:MAG TPA: HEAT repeat domain-containing protein [Verrucomicrobiales bacterium]|nr:HEAT repeat domain-containing protein [Verrucomicrobiales bacterium]
MRSFGHPGWKNLHRRAGVVCVSLTAVGLFWGLVRAPALRAEDDPAARVRALAEELKSDDEEARRKAAYELTALGKEAEPAVAALTDALSDSDAQVWFQAVTALALIGPGAETAAPVLMEGLTGEGRGRGRSRRSREQVWYRSAYALSQIGPAVLPRLREATRSDDLWIRAGAAKAIGWQGPAAAEAIPDLTALLADEHRDVRAEALEAMAEMGTAAVAALIPVLGHEQAAARKAATEALGILGEEAVAARESLFQLWQEETDPECRAALLTALRRTGFDPAELAVILETVLREEDGPARDAAVNNLMVLPEAKRTAVPLVAKLLKSPEVRDRSTAALIAGRLGAAAAEAAPDLIALACASNEREEPGESPYRTALQEMGWAAWPAVCAAVAEEDLALMDDEHWAVEFTRSLALSGVETLAGALSGEGPQVRLLALQGLRPVARQAREAFEAVASQIEDPEARIRSVALRTAAAMRPEGRKLHALLQRGFEDDSAEVRVAAVAGVTLLDSDPEVILPLLLTAISDVEPSVQLEGIRALGDLGADAAGALDLLRVCIREGNAEARIAALETLASIGSGAAGAAEEAAVCLEKGTPGLRSAALAALGGMGRAAERHLPLVESSLDDEETAVRAAAVAALVRMEPDREKALPRLEHALSDASFEVRKPALEALGEMGEAARPVAEKLFALLGEDADRPLAMRAIREIRPREAALYVSVLEHKEAEVRQFSCVALGRLGSDAEQTVPELRKRLRDEYDFVRDAAREALRRIEGRS